MQAKKTADGESDEASDAAKVPPVTRTKIMATVTSVSSRSTAQAVEAAVNGESLLRYGTSSIYTCMCTCIGARGFRIICA